MSGPSVRLLTFVLLPEPQGRKLHLKPEPQRHHSDRDVLAVSEALLNVHVGCDPFSVLTDLCTREREQVVRLGELTEEQP